MARPFALLLGIMAFSSCDSSDPSGLESEWVGDSAVSMDATDTLPRRAELTLTLDGTFAWNRAVDYVISGAAPGEEVNLGLSISGRGDGPCPSVLEGTCLDILPGLIRRTAIADGTGVARISVTVPSGVGPDVSSQAVIIRGGGAVVSLARTDTAAIDCGNVLPPAAGTCDITAGTSATLLRGLVLAPTQPLLGGEVLVDAAGDIVCVGCDCSGEPEYATATVASCPTGAITAGLTIPHDHIDFTEGAPIDHGATRYDHRHEWRAALATPPNPNGTCFDCNGTRWGEVRMVMSGVTSMVGQGAAHGMVRNLETASAREGLNIQRVFASTFPLGDSDSAYHGFCDWSYIYTAEEIAGEQAYVAHVAEGIDLFAYDEFQCQSRPDGAALDVNESNTAHVHAMGLLGEDYFLMGHDGAQLVWSPRSNVSLYGMTADVVTFNRAGGRISLGTDWTYTGSINALRELACVDDLNQAYYKGWFSDRQIHEMVTVNGAVAMGVEGLLGSLAPGLVADLAVFDASTSSNYRAVIDAAPEDVALVMRAGLPLYGDASILAGLGSSCEAVDVCGASKAMCASQEFSGTTYATLQAMGSYPAFFCGGPPVDEPTCLPSRPGEFDGVITATDLDGDGFDNGSDNCPEHFNPIRPIDFGLQVDADGDGIGDPCDGTPFGSDLDGDTIDNGVDNCPVHWNYDQVDGDGDGKGDVCDGCDLIFNPTLSCTSVPATIEDIQLGVVSVDEVVALTGVVVTAEYPLGIVVQDPNASSAEWSGVFVFTNGTHGELRDDELDLTATVVEYFGETMLITPDIAFLGLHAPLAPTPITVAQATAEEWEGVLVTLTDGVVTDAAYDCGVDDPGCADPNLWEIGGPNGVLAYDRFYEDADWASNIGNLPVTGVMGYRWSRRRIMPRTTSDL